MENSEIETQVTEVLSTSDGVIDSVVDSTESGTIQADNSVDVLTNIYNDVHVIMVLLILTFAMSCMRAWRKNTLKGV